MIGNVFSKMFGGSSQHPTDPALIPQPQQPIHSDSFGASMPVDPVVQASQQPVAPPPPPDPVVPPPQPVQPPPPPLPQQQNASDVPFDNAYRDKIGVQLTQRLVDAVEEEKLTEGEMSVISGHILDTIDTVKSHDELIAYLNELSWRWPVFRQLLKVEKGVGKEANEDEKAQEITDLIKENKVDEALKMAENATFSVT